MSNYRITKNCAIAIIVTLVCIIFINSVSGISMFTHETTYSKGQLVFPIDEGDKDTESDWWYITSHFVTESGKKFSYTVVYFGENPTYYTRQTAIVDITNKTYYRHWLKGNFTSEKYSLNLTYSNSNGDHDYWYQISMNKLFNYRLFTEIDELYALNVTLSANKLPLINGGIGVIPMGYDGDSYYYSQTNLTINGTFIHDGIIETIQGIAWIDRQWGNWSRTGYDGWEWFALQLNDDTQIMLYLFFDPKTGEMITPTLDIMFNNGSYVDLDENEFDIEYLGYWEASDVPGNWRNLFVKRYYSSGWIITIPKYNINLSITPIIKNQRVSTTGWEGSCYVNGTHDGTIINSISTVELTHHYSKLNYLNIFIACILSVLVSIGVIGTVYRYLIKSQSKKS